MEDGKILSLLDFLDITAVISAFAGPFALTIISVPFAVYE